MKAWMKISTSCVTPAPALDPDSPCGQHMMLVHLDHQDKEQLQCTLARLENENRVLQGEYRRLKWKHEEAASVPMLTEAGEDGLGSPTAEGQQDEELLAEARVLRQHKTRLETRMQILEDHNKQLESQLHRLRELLLQPKDDSEANGSEPSTLSSPVSGGGHHGEPASRETTDTEAAGDDMEQDTVLQLQEVIEQLRNVFPSEPGELVRPARLLRQPREMGLEEQRDSLMAAERSTQLRSGPCDHSSSSSSSSYDTLS
ncbi:unnamed protein product [Pleuronectes platessa]|uniref:Dystrophin-related protein 2 n=1 Tax=Pleuronectes platessa TaxID=8262 RepID=A0A9N7UQX7_PLEPL|nr:unnamed protein product [Pleuronectes platessa]